MTFQLHPQLAADSFVLGQFELCQLLLINDQQYPWFVLVPQRDNIKEIYQLSALDQTSLLAESMLLSQVIMNIYQGDKLNLAAIGNMVPQLHLHHIVRFEQDPCWPKPVWGQRPMEPYEASKVKLIQQKLIDNLINENYTSR